MTIPNLGCIHVLQTLQDISKFAVLDKLLFGKTTDILYTATSHRPHKVTVVEVTKLVSCSTLCLLTVD